MNIMHLILYEQTFEQVEHVQKWFSYNLKFWNLLKCIPQLPLLTRFMSRISSYKRLNYVWKKIGHYSYRLLFVDCCLLDLCIHFFCFMGDQIRIDIDLKVHASVIQSCIYNLKELRLESQIYYLLVIALNLT